MQKAISSFLLILSLLLLFLSTSTSSVNSLKNTAPFSQIDLSSLPDEKIYTKEDFGLTNSIALPSSLHAKSFCLIDADSGRTLYGMEENKQMPMASTTKIMTCIIALENGDLNSKVTVSSYAASMPDVQLNMQTGDTFYLKDLLYSLMLESHNDTAVAIAEHIGKSVKGFASLMNNKAKELGCTNTNFVTPNGLDDKSHYTTAKELCLIARYAILNKNFLKITQTTSHQFTNCKKTRSYSVRNHDAFLTNYKGAIGIKTGFTGNAGYCFCGAAKKDGKTLVSSVLACGWPPNKSYKWSDSKKLMDYGFANFQKKTLQTLNFPTTLPITNGITTKVAIKNTAKKNVSFMVSADDQVKITTTLPPYLKAPIRQGDILGYEEVYFNDELAYQFPILAKSTVPKRGLQYFFKLSLKLFFQTNLS